MDYRKEDWETDLEPGKVPRPPYLIYVFREWYDLDPKFPAPIQATIKDFVLLGMFEEGKRCLVSVYEGKKFKEKFCQVKENLSPKVRDALELIGDEHQVSVACSLTREEGLKEARLAVQCLAPWEYKGRSIRIGPDVL